MSIPPTLQDLVLRPSKSQTTPGRRTKCLPWKVDTGGYHLPRSIESLREDIPAVRVSTPEGVPDKWTVSTVKNYGSVTINPKLLT